MPVPIHRDHPRRLLVEGETIPDDSRPRNGTPFKDVHRTKAEIHTWLAWQDPTDLRLHEAVKHTVLDPARLESRPFVDWFKRLFGV